MRADDIGACRAWCKGDDASFIFHPDEWDALRTAFLNGATVFEGRASYGDPLLIRMVNVVAINVQSAEISRQIIADRKADKAQELIEGDE